jgi:hypothetical protein
MFAFGVGSLRVGVHHRGVTELGRNAQSSASRACWVVPKTTCDHEVTGPGHLDGATLSLARLAASRGAGEQITAGISFGSSEPPRRQSLDRAQGETLAQEAVSENKQNEDRNRGDDGESHKPRPIDPECRYLLRENGAQGIRSW